jgi:hypothetical protein
MRVIPAWVGKSGAAFLGVVNSRGDALLLAFFAWEDWYPV